MKGENSKVKFYYFFKNYGKNNLAWFAVFLFVFGYVLIIFGVSYAYKEEVNSLEESNVDIKNFEEDIIENDQEKQKVIDFMNGLTNSPI